MLHNLSLHANTIFKKERNYAMKNEMPDTKEFANYNTEYDYLQSASTQDCTGLIPIAPATEAERINNEELYPILPQLALKSALNQVED